MPYKPSDGRDFCVAHSKTTGQRCKRYPLAHFTVCFHHGGAAPQVIRAANDRRNTQLATARALNFLQRNGYRKVDDPVEALSQLAGEVIAAKDYFRSKIEELRYTAQSGEQLRAEVGLYERALDRCIKVLEVLARLGISERRTVVAEAEAVMLAGVIECVLSRLDLSPAQAALALEVVPQELRAITAPPAEAEAWVNAEVIP